MDGIDIDGTPFTVLMDRAMKLKTLQSKHERVKFDSYPSFYANTLFPNNNNDDAVIVDAARQLIRFDERLVIATRLKDEGNSAFHDGARQLIRFDERIVIATRLKDKGNSAFHDDARTKYEMAVSIFRYLVNTNAEWKTQGTIKDTDLREMEYKCQSEVEQDKLNAFLISCYNNIALVSNKLHDFTLAVLACDYSIAISSNDKAYYLRARARLGPKSSGAKEVMLARNDLTMALACNPTNAEAQKLLSRLDNDAREQRRKDKVAFQGLFNRGLIYEHDTTRNEATTTAATKKMPQDDVERDIILGRQLSQLYEERGMHKEKEQIEQSLKQYDHARSAVNDNSLDFRNPTKTMIDDANSMGVDLTDPTTIALLETLKDKQRLIIETKSDDGHSMKIRPRMTMVWQFLLLIVLVISIVWVVFV